MHRSRVWIAVGLLGVAVTGWSAPARGQESATVLEDNGLEITNPAGRLFKVESLIPVSMVVLGESGGVDANFYIKDPNFSIDSNSLVFDASSALLTLGSGRATEDGADGDLSVRNKSGTETIRLDGDGARATQSIAGDGFVKAWARVAPDGTLLSSYNVTSVDNPATGVYFVDLLGDADRPMTATLDNHNSTPVIGFISIGFPDDFHPGTKQVVTRNSLREPANLGFNLVVY